MEIVIDTSAIIAVIMGEPEKNRIIKLTSGKTLIGPGSIPWEIGNAFSRMLKQGRLKLDEAQKGISIFQGISIQYTQLELLKALSLANQVNMYAYDSYFLECAISHQTPILTLDQKMVRAAKQLNIEIVEI
ncbi:PIN domain-containing protein [bacterium]|nr:PIN domain-containing protein [bacterium]